MNPCNVVAQLVTSQPVAEDLTLTCFSCTDLLGPSRITRKQLASSIEHSALVHVVRGFPLLQQDRSVCLEARHGNVTRTTAASVGVVSH